jgi:hypothetical protein
VLPKYPTHKLLDRIDRNLRFGMHLYITPISNYISKIFGRIKPINQNQFI